MDRLTSSSRPLEACNTCRKRKVKCDRERPSCGPCSKSQTQCAYTERVRVLKAPRRRPTRAKQLEDRLERMESLLKVPVALLEKVVKDTTSSVTQSALLSNSVSNQALEPMMPSNIAPKVILQPASETPEGPGEGYNSSPDTREMSIPFGNTNASDQNHAPRIFKSLQTEEEMRPMLDFYFQRFNSVIPLFDQQTFMRIFHKRQAMNSHTQDPSWWACLNLVLAFGSRLQAFSLTRPVDGDQEAWAYIENSLAMVPSISILTPSLLSIQALIGMVVFLQATPMSRPYSLLIATAIRFGHSIGLHRQEAYMTGLTGIEIEQRKRVFWITYLLDKDFSMRSGHPALEHDDEIDVEFPCDRIQDDGIGYVFLSHGLWPMNFFRLRIQLSIIQSAIHKNLYSAKAAKQPDDVRKMTVQELDERLRQWKNSTSLDFQPEYLKRIVKEPMDILHLMILYFTYFNCLTLVHRSSFQNMSWRHRSPNAIEPFNPRNFSSKPIVIDAGRNALNLLKLLPQNNYVTVWVVLQFSVSAIITLLRNIQLNPSTPTALPDFQLAEPFLGLFCQLAAQHVGTRSNHGLPNSPLRNPTDGGGIVIELLRMREFCFVLRDAAKKALEAVSSISSSPIHGDGAATSENDFRHLSEREIQIVDAEISRRIRENAERDDNKSRAAFVMQFQSTFHERAKRHKFPLQLLAQNDARALPPSEEVSSGQSIRSDNSAAKISFLNLPASYSSSPSQQDETTLWNWWDLIEMDAEIKQANIQAIPNSR